MINDAASIPINFNESAIAPYCLPDPLVADDGQAIDRMSWPTRRQELRDLFERHVYGLMPRAPSTCGLSVTTEVVEEGQLGDWATRRQITLTFSNGSKNHTARVLMYLPAECDRPVGVFTGLNFFGNQTIHTDEAIHLTDRWVRNSESLGIDDHRANDQTRGTLAHRWQIELVVSRGYGLATVYCGDFDPDFDDGYENGLHPLLYGGHKPAADESGTLGVWAWGLSRICDYLVDDIDVDPRGIAVIGHSRLGKTALWASACDERFALTVSNNSGCGGAALSRRQFGENVAYINTQFPHWFCDNFRRYNDREEHLPVDQHMLISLIAPRPVYVASAAEDLWADPKGEFLACVNADPVYRLLCDDGLPTHEMPQTDTPIHGKIGYHIRRGKHDLLRHDWEHCLNFADRHLDIA